MVINQIFTLYSKREQGLSYFVENALSLISSVLSMSRECLMKIEIQPICTSRILECTFINSSKKSQFLLFKIVKIGVGLFAMRKF